MKNALEQTASTPKTSDEILSQIRNSLWRNRKTAHTIPKQSPQPLVSIVVLNLNGESIISACLEHLLLQTYSHFEIIALDNGSSDRSLSILREYEAKDARVRVLEASRNLGVSGGRNFALEFVRGDIVAFMDSDGYAHSEWLTEAVATLLSDDRAGAVGSTVFFNSNKLILNGAGGGMNRQGYAGDLCYQAPFEFAQIPRLAIYPMGCGMLAKTHLARDIFPLDEKPVKWFDDTELGIRVWRRGFKVLVCDTALIDHDLNTSDQYLGSGRWRITFLFERARIRTVLKYWPLRALPRWFLQELGFDLEQTRTIGLHYLPLKALCWLWNLLLLPSACATRKRFGALQATEMGMLENAWGKFPPPALPNNRFQLNVPTLGPELDFGSEDGAQLLYGWHELERHQGRECRWSNGCASVAFDVPEAVGSISMGILPSADDHSITLVMRRLGEIRPLTRELVQIRQTYWNDITLRVSLAKGQYEILLLGEPNTNDRNGKCKSFAVSGIRLNSAAGDE